jgi:hypothetical protein
LTTCTTISWPSCTSEEIEASVAAGGGGASPLPSAPDLLRLLRQAQDVGGVQEGGALQPDLDEGGLHARHHPLHAPL